ncbi:polycystin-2 [Musca vetustissima]|uniref:polycystin-2 n=1 Tax=Musca vetustissima TaxID=27455 RepID=UPI002AB6773F|nr:polycystin-2 [Musca vetustissima]
MGNVKKFLKYSFFLGTGLAILCLVLITQFSGYRHETKKFKQILITIIIGQFLRFLLWDHVEAVITALYETTFKKNYNKTYPLPQENMEWKMNPLEYLKLRLKSSKADFYLPEEHKNESLNLEYYHLTKDLWLFGRYFFVLLLMIVYSRYSMAYYNTKLMKTIFLENRLGAMGVQQMRTLEDLYEVLNVTMSGALCQGVDYRGIPLAEYGWMDFEIAKLLGVVRIQQIRVRDKTNGMRDLKVYQGDYLPQWKPLDRSYYYVDKFWRIYYPWMRKTSKHMVNWLFALTHIGSLYGPYSEDNAYVAFLARDSTNNAKILKFLKENSWLDDRTLMVLIDFTLYSADGNIFSLISLMAEQTPFGGVIWNFKVQSVALLTNVDQLSCWWCLLIIIYTLQLIEFSNVLFLKWWWCTEEGVGGFFHSSWNCVDLVIILLNVIITALLLIREFLVKALLLALISSHKLEHLDFRHANLVDYMATVAIGFLVALTTLRLWKILQFASVFRLFTRTLYSAAGSLITTLLGIHIFLFAIGFAAEIVNGSQAEAFSRYLKSLTSIMSFSFGFNSHTRPEDLSHGGNILGFIIYLILMFVVAIFLINMFITLICDHLAAAREERDNQKREYRLSYWEYLKMEFQLEETYETSTEVLEKLDDIYEADRLKAQRIRNVQNILKLQMDILKRVIDVNYLEWESDEEEERK